MRDRFDPAELIGIIGEQRITLISLVPTMLGRMLDQQWSAPPHLRAILLGGAAAPRRLLERAAARGLPVLVTYGLTEACSQVTTTRYETRFAPLGEGSGEPLTGIEVAIRDGHIHVSGATMMAGYWNEAPLVPGAWFDTGDLGTLDERGRLHVQARRADLIVTGGENVYPAEVEDALEAFAGIEKAGVFGVADEEWGQLVAAAVAIRGEPPVDRVLAEFLAARLAPHKRPRRICLVDALPQTEAGKLDRARLREIAGRLRPLSYRDDN
jgi:O-succinylbenzoic acid--CoA ligase